MPPTDPDRHPQDDLLIAMALCWFSEQYDGEPELRERAWEISQELCELHGLEPGDAVLQLE